MQLAAAVNFAQVLLAQQDTSGPSASLSWAIVLFFTLLGLIVTLSPPRRTYEVKKPRED